MVEAAERVRFRRGENANRPIGGHVADAPFAKALHDLMIDSFESQNSLAKALGRKSNWTVSKWLLDRYIPTSEEFINLLVLFINTNDKNDEKINAFVGAYAQERSRGRGVRGRRQSEKSRRVIKPLEGPLNQWIGNFCSHRKIPRKQFLRTIDYSKLPESRVGWEMDSLKLILQVSESFGLSEEERENLYQAVSLEIQQTLQEGRIVQSDPNPSHLKIMQRKLAYRTYNGAEAAIELGVSRQWVSKKRQQFNLQFLLTEGDIEMLREDLKKTEAFREKLRQTRMKSPSGEINLSQ